MRAYAEKSRSLVWLLLVCLLLFGGLLGSLFLGFDGAQAVGHTAAATPTPAPPATEAAVASGERTPLADIAATLDPPAVWEAFNSLEQVPRASHHEEQATAFLADFGNSLGLETSVDDVGNVIIRKPATPGMTLTATPADLPDLVMEQEGAARLVAAIYGAHNGVQKMSDSVPGLTETSTNLGILTDTAGVVVMGHLVRSAVDSERDDLAHMLRAVYELAGAEVSFGEPYSGWAPNPDSPIVVLMQQVYADLYGKPATLTALHAGLETSVIGATYPGMDMISIGPNLHDVHTPNERLEVASVAKIYDLVVATLAQMPVQ